MEAGGSAGVMMFRKTPCRQRRSFVAMGRDRCSVLRLPAKFGNIRVAAGNMSVD